jgi:hypothetical protein
MPPWRQAMFDLHGTDSYSVMDQRISVGGRLSLGVGQTNDLRVILGVYERKGGT